MYGILGPFGRVGSGPLPDDHSGAPAILPIAPRSCAASLLIMLNSLATTAAPPGTAAGDLRSNVLPLDVPVYLVIDQ